MYGVILEESKGNFIPYTFTHFNNSEHERLIRQFKEDQLFIRACLKNALCNMSDQGCGRLNYLADNWPNEGGLGGKGINGNALRRLNLVQISRFK